MENKRQRKQDRLELESPLPLIPTQQRRVFHDDEVDSDQPQFDTNQPQFQAQMPLEDAVAAIVENGLSDRDQSILDFEKQWWRHAGAKEQAIRDKFELSGTRYYQILNALLDNPAALEHDPVLVGRLRRLRGSRSRSRGR